MYRLTPLVTGHFVSCVSMGTGTKDIDECCQCKESQSITVIIQKVPQSVMSTYEIAPLHRHHHHGVELLCKIWIEFILLASLYMGKEYTLRQIRCRHSLIRMISEDVRLASDNFPELKPSLNNNDRGEIFALRRVQWRTRRHLTLSTSRVRPSHGCLSLHCRRQPMTV